MYYTRWPLFSFMPLFPQLDSSQFIDVAKHSQMGQR